MELNGLDNFFDQADEVTTRRHSGVDTQVIEFVDKESWHAFQVTFGIKLPKELRSKEKLPEIKRFINWKLQLSKKHEVNKIIYWPKPYGKIDDNVSGAKFTICEDVKPYMNQVHGIRNYLKMGFDVDMCIKAHIQGMKDESVLEILPEPEREKALKEVKEERDCFLHYTILAYTGFFKAVKKQKEDVIEQNKKKWMELVSEVRELNQKEMQYRNSDGEQIDYVRLSSLKKQVTDLARKTREKIEDLHQYIPAIETARELAIDSLIEAAKVYNPNIKPESVEDRCRNEKDTVQKISDSVDEISDLFAQYFYDPTDAKTKLESIQRRHLFYEAMHMNTIETEAGIRYGMIDVLKEVEKRTEIQDSVTHIPSFFSNMFERFAYLGSNGNGNGN